MAPYDDDNNPYSWMPGFLRRFLNLEYDASGPSQSAGQASSSYAAPAPTARAGWSPPSEPSFKASSMEGYHAPSGGAPSSSYTPPAEYRAPTSGVNTGTVVSPADTAGTLQPVTYALRGLVGGVLPPQGIEAFSKELRATGTDVWNLYSRLFRFQTQDVFRFGQVILRAASDAAGAASHTNGAHATARRIKVTVASDNPETAADAATGK